LFVGVLSLLVSPISSLVCVFLVAFVVTVAIITGGFSLIAIIAVLSTWAVTIAILSCIAVSATAEIKMQALGFQLNVLVYTHRWPYPWLEFSFPLELDVLPSDVSVLPLLSVCTV
jgi:hypothetical protein